MAETKTRPCGLCGAQATWTFRQTLLGRHEVDYFVCASCDLLQTEEAHWLAEAYSHALTHLDTGAVERNTVSSQLTELLAQLIGVDASAPCLDYGAGHGVFVRMMRDIGLDFHWFDTHADNLFARGFEGSPEAHYRLVTAFEVLEHFATPSTDLERLFGPRHEFILVGTVLHAGHQPGWWYYLVESGQHVCFYSAKTMEYIATRFGYRAVVGPEHTLFIRDDVSISAPRLAMVAKTLSHPRWALRAASLVPSPIRRRISGFRSRLQRDYELLKTRTPS